MGGHGLCYHVVRTLALAIVIYIGAFVVSDDVYAAKSAGLDDTVAGWKHNLVGVCPLH